MLQQTEVQPIQKAVMIIHQMSDDEKIQELARLREKALHDEASALSSARKEGALETLADLVRDGIITLQEGARRANMSVSEFEAKTGLKALFLRLAKKSKMDTKHKTDKSEPLRLGFVCFLFGKSKLRCCNTDIVNITCSKRTALCCTFRRSLSRLRRM